jgi:hypothetical protein
MRKAKTVRIGGFVGALCASAALVGFGVSGTGAYFTDSHTGSINVSTGHIKVDVDPANGQLNFANLLPGEYQTQRVNYTAHPSSGSEDIWLVFPNAETGHDAFIDQSASGPTPLGRYGHFGVTSTGGASFVSSNLSLSPHGYNDDQSCTIDANGEGGSSATADSTSSQIPYCSPAHAILLQSGMGDGATGYADLTFGFTKLLKSGQDSPGAALEAFKIVATQHGIRPDDVNNG